MEYPLHEKLQQNKETLQAVSDFLDFLMDNDLIIAKYQQVDKDTHTLYPYLMAKANLVGLFIGIDPVELEAEKKRMLENINK